MTGYAFCSSWLAFRKLFPEDRFPFVNGDPSTMQDCKDSSKCTWLLVRLSLNVLHPLLVAITTGIAHTLRTTLVTNEKSTYPIYLSLFDPLLRLGSQTLCVINSPGEATSDSNPTSPDAVATGGRTRATTANKTDGPSGPVEFIFKDADGNLVFIVEVRRTLHTGFGKALGRLCHQLIAMALTNHHNNSRGPVRGFLTDAYTWIGVEFTLTHVPEIPDGHDIMLKELKGQFKCSGAINGLVPDTVDTGIGVHQDFELVISTLAQSLIKDVATMDVEASLKAYEDQMRTEAAQLLAGHPHIGALAQLIGGGSEPAVQPAAQPAAQPATQRAQEPAAQPAAQPATQQAQEPAAEPAEEPAAEPAAKRQKIEDGQSIAVLVQAAVEPALDYSLCVDPQQLLQLYQAAAAAVRRLIPQCASKMGAEGVAPACKSVLAALRKMHSVAQQPADEVAAAAAGEASTSFITELNQLAAALTTAAGTGAQ